MATRRFLKWFFVALLPIVGTVFALHNDITGFINFWLNRTKPQILDVKNCSVSIISSTGQGNIWFELIVNNPAPKPCSIISMDLILAGFNQSKFNWDIPLPKTIPANQAERIIVSGSFLGGGLELQPTQNSADATVAVKFNTGHTIKQKITFTVWRYPS